MQWCCEYFILNSSLIIPPNDRIHNWYFEIISGIYHILLLNDEIKCIIISSIIVTTWILFYKLKEYHII